MFDFDRQPWESAVGYYGSWATLGFVWFVILAQAAVLVGYAYYGGW